MPAIPLIGHTDLETAVAYRGARPLSAADYIADVMRVAEGIPAERFLVNFCNDRYNFAVGLGAALVRGQISLLPPNRTNEMLAQLRDQYPGLYVLTDDADEEATGLTSIRIAAGAEKGSSAATIPRIPASQVAVIAFTSGSTGAPGAHPKAWGNLAAGAVGEALRLGIETASRTILVGTVPPQHMYGLESSVLLALRNGLSFHAARPFYPLDVRTALEDVTGRRVLITTPVHLRALVTERLPLPALSLVVCATAMLAPELAAQTEAYLGAPLHEIYGFTEAGMVAARRTTQGEAWHTLPGVRAHERDGVIFASGGHVQAEVPFTDIVELKDEEHFVLRGRNADLVNIAGKRTSLAYLNYQLNSIAGVDDGVFLMPDESASTTRLMAFVVAPRLPRKDLLLALRSRIEDVFLPRPLYFVASLPRNPTGKLPRESLIELARTCSAKAKREHSV
ncbi:MAG: AMP-binding protein [Betaproteobacteria bacterium]